MINIEDIKNYFNDLSFDEDNHIYRVSGEQCLISVSQMPKNFYLPFDVEYYSKQKAITSCKTPEQIKKEWKLYALERASFGTQVHAFAEQYAYNKTLLPSNPQEEAVIRFFLNLPKYYTHMLPEFRMYHKEYFFSGSADLFAYNNKTKKFDVFDYKTSKDLYKFYGDYMLEPFSSFKNISYNHFVITLSLYQILFEQTKHKVGNRYIVWLTPSGKVKVLPCEDVTKDLKKWLEKNYEKIYNRGIN